MTLSKNIDTYAYSVHPRVFNYWANRYLKTLIPCQDYVSLTNFLDSMGT